VTRTNSLCLRTLTFYPLHHKLYALYACKLDFLNNTATRAHYTNYKCHIIEQYIQFVYYLPVDSAVH